MGAVMRLGRIGQLFDDGLHLLLGEPVPSSHCRVAGDGGRHGVARFLQEVLSRELVDEALQRGGRVRRPTDGESPWQGVDHPQSLFPLPYVETVLGDQREVFQQALVLELVESHPLVLQPRIEGRAHVDDRARS